LFSDALSTSGIIYCHMRWDSDCGGWAEKWIWLISSYCSCICTIDILYL